MPLKISVAAKKKGGLGGSPPHKKGFYNGNAVKFISGELQQKKKKRGGWGPMNVTGIQW